jgi:hypothetical protein
VACIEAYPFKADLDIFGQLNAKYEVPEMAGVILAAVCVTFGSKQIHDLGTSLKAFANRKMNPPETPSEFGSLHG